MLTPNRCNLKPEKNTILGSIPTMFTGTRTESYEDIDRPSAVPPQGPAQVGGYNFATAQQI